MTYLKKLDENWNKKGILTKKNNEYRDHIEYKTLEMSKYVPTRSIIIIYYF